MGKFDLALMEYDDDFLFGAYEEVQFLLKTGAFPDGQKYFRKLVDLRHELYQNERNIDAVKIALMEELARRWRLTKMKK